MLAGALSALVVVGVLALVAGRAVIGGGHPAQADACGDLACQLRRCAQARSDSTDRRGSQAPCPYVDGGATAATVRTRRRVTWHFAPRPGP